MLEWGTSSFVCVSVMGIQSTKSYCNLWAAVHGVQVGTRVYCVKVKMWCCRVIGTPQESEWPENVSLNWSSFAQHHPVALESLLPEICEQGQDVLQVLHFCGLVCVNVCVCIFHTFMYHQCIIIIWEQLQTLGKWVPVTVPLDMEGWKARDLLKWLEGELHCSRQCTCQWTGKF